VTDHQRRAGALAEQFNELAVQDINSFSQFFKRHLILVLRFAHEARLKRVPTKRSA
jgi:hypothetical protein